MTYGTTTRLALTFAAAVDVEDYVILGACNPPLAHRALEADRSLGLLLPCNVVVRAIGDEETIVEMLHPGVMSQLSDASGLDDLAVEASQRLQAARDKLAVDALPG